MINNLNDEAAVTFQFTSDDRIYTIVINDERPDMDLDPTLAVFRGDEEEPIATLHLNPEAACYEKGHVVARKDYGEGPDD
jgi:hypothetical protein